MGERSEISLDQAGAAGPSRAAAWLWTGAVLCLVAGGGLLWWRGGEAVFASMVSAALALCF